MTIYQILFGVDQGQVHCAFHQDSRTSAGVSAIGQYNCFACGAKAHNEIGFIKKYFGVGDTRAKRIQTNLKAAYKYRHKIKNKLEPDQISYLAGQGITDEVMNKYFFNSVKGKLIYEHTFNGVQVGYTIFNHQSLKGFNVSQPKYKYAWFTTAGILSPFSDLLKSYKNIIITEGEKDMLTAKSVGIPNVVAKVGGATTYMIGAEPLRDRNVILIYDCDDPGRKGAKQDAQYLSTRFNSTVKIVDLGLQDKEDLNDYFIKYNKTPQDLATLIRSTDVYVPTEDKMASKVTRFVENLTRDEYDELVNYLKTKGDDINE